MRKLIKKALLLALTIAVLPLGSINTAKAATAYVSATKLDGMLQTASGTANSFIVAGEIANPEASITRTAAAQMINRAYEAKNGTDLDKDVFFQVYSLGRISDIKKVAEVKRDAVYNNFARGIDVGYSNGVYTKTRSFKGANKLTLDEAKVVCARIADPATCKKLSPDGQVIRTTNLPKNASSFSYILAAVPNKYYEVIHRWQWDYFSKAPVENKDYWKPVNFANAIYYDRSVEERTAEYTRAYWEDWAKKAETNVKTRLSVNYKTISTGNKWMTTLMGTYYNFEMAQDKKQEKEMILSYIRYAKNNKVAIKCKEVYADQSSIYASGDAYYIRVHAKFMVTSAVKVPKEGNGLVFGLLETKGLYCEGLAKNKWIEIVSDICIAGGVNHTNSDMAVFQDGLCNKQMLHPAKFIAQAKADYGKFD